MASGVNMTNMDRTLTTAGEPKLSLHQKLRANLGENCFIILLTVILCAGLMEVGLRCIGRTPTNTAESFLEQGGISYQLKRNVTKIVRWPSYSYTVITDAAGARYRELGTRQLGGKTLFVALGSSEVFGNGLDYDQTFVGVLAKNLERQGCDLVNLAVPGHHLDEQIALFKEAATGGKLRPDVVLVFVNPIYLGGFDDIHANSLVFNGYLFPTNNWRIPALRMTLSNVSAAYCFFRDATRKLQRLYLARPDMDMSFYTRAYSKEHRIHQPQNAAEMLAHLKQLEASIREVHAIPICIFVPTVGGFKVREWKAKGHPAAQACDPDYVAELVRNHCQQEGIQFLNLEPLLQARYDKGEKLNFDLDAHFNGPTSQVIGDYLHTALAALSTRK